MLDDYTCFVGPNGAGESTVLTALNGFFRETTNASTDTLTLTKEDFHLSDVSQPIKIEVTFEDLGTDAQEDFKDYFRNGKLVISAVAVWNEGNQSAPVFQFGERLGMDEFRIYFEKDKAAATAKDLQDVYGELKKKFTDLPNVKVKQQMKDALHEYEAPHPDKCVLIPSQDQFYGVSRGIDRLQKYIQWLYVPAVKDASSEQDDTKNTAIGKLLARRVHSQLNLDESINQLKEQALEQYRILIASKKDGLKSLSDALNQRFHKWGA